jgi:sulfite exporter TauE/SafE
MDTCRVRTAGLVRILFRFLWGLMPCFLLAPAYVYAAPEMTVLVQGEALSVRSTVPGTRGLKWHLLPLV